MLADIDASAGCSIKDSFACLDLSGLGFRVLFEAQWIISATIPSTSTSTATATGRLSWAVVRSDVELLEWESAWGGTAGTRLFTTRLLDDDRVLVLAGRFAGVVVSGAVLSRGDDVDVVGLSNFFVAPEHADGARSDCAVFASSLVPGSYLFGYESGAELADAVSAGFEPIGPLRIWLRDIA